MRRLKNVEALCLLAMVVGLLGSPCVYAGDPFLSLVGEVSGDLFGNSLAVGDIDFDGNDDLIVGAPYHDVGDSLLAGKVYTFFGGPAGDSLPDFTYEGESAGAFTGYAVCLADLNGDESPDMVMGAPQMAAEESLGTGSVIVVWGDTDGDNVVLTGEGAGDHFGCSVASAGDVNGDDIEDLVVGAFAGDAYGNADAGKAYIFFGGDPMDTLPDVIMCGERSVDLFGWSVSSAGDMNDDGYDDVIVGAWSSRGTGASYPDIGRAYVYFGGVAVDSLVDLIMEGEEEGDFFGWSVASAGDVNGDGYDDVIGGSPQYDYVEEDETGRAYIFLGGEDPDQWADVVLTGESAYDFFGWQVRGIGDLDGDGYDDVAVGAVQGEGGGRSYVYLGSSSMDIWADETFVGYGTGGYFGGVIQGTGDWSGDGRRDVIISAYNGGPDGEGMVYLFSGGGITGISEEMVYGSPSACMLMPLVPNPFSQSAVVRYRVGQDAAGSTVSLCLYNVSGSLVRHLTSGPMRAGDHRVRWDGTDDRGRPLASGIYVCQLVSGQLRDSQKILLLR
jgi:hypothetical protein